MSVAIRGTAVKSLVADSITFIQSDFSVAPQLNDVLVAFTATTTVYGEIGSTGFLQPTGWTYRSSNSSSSSSVELYGGMAIYTKVATASEGSYVFDTQGGGQSSIIHIFVLSGVDAANMLDGTVSLPLSTNTGANTSQDAPAITTSSTNSFLLCNWMATYSTIAAASWTPPAGMTETFDTSASQANNMLVLASSFKQLSTAGATGLQTGTMTRANPHFTIGASIALKTAATPQISSFSTASMMGI